MLAWRHSPRRMEVQPIGASNEIWKVSAGPYILPADRTCQLRRQGHGIFLTRMNVTWNIFTLTQNPWPGFDVDGLLLAASLILGPPYSRKKNVKRLSVVLFLDLKDVYGNVTHEAILEALEAAELGRHVFRWVKKYLSIRSMFFVTGDGRTNIHFSSRVVPQSGVLSPTLVNSIWLWSGSPKRYHRRLMSRSTPMISSYGFLASDGLECAQESRKRQSWHLHTFADKVCQSVQKNMHSWRLHANRCLSTHCAPRASQLRIGLTGS